MHTKTTWLPTLACLSMLLPIEAHAATASGGGLDWSQIIAFGFIGLLIGAVIAFFNRRR